MDSSHQSYVSPFRLPVGGLAAWACAVLCAVGGCSKKGTNEPGASPEKDEVANHEPAPGGSNNGPKVKTVANLQSLGKIFRDRLSQIETFEPLDTSGFVHYAQVLERALFAKGEGVQSWSDVSLEQFSVQSPSVELTSLMESGKRRSGLPQVLWKSPKPGQGEPKMQGGWILQAPHRFFDRRTGELALALFARQDPRNAKVLFLNTKHRYAQSDGSKKKKEHNPSDVCHNASHGFQRITQKVMLAMNSNEIVQLHGFGPKNKKRDKALAIVSSGNPSAASPRAHALVSALRKHFGAGILLFPRDTSQLGATTNVQGHMVKSYAAREPERSENGFLHIEMSQALRTSLLEDPKALDAFAEILFEVMSAKQDQGARE